MAEISEAPIEHSSNQQTNPLESIPDDSFYIPLVHVQEILTIGTDSQEEK